MTTLDDMMRDDAPLPSEDALTRIRDAIRRRRDLAHEIGALEERLTAARAAAEDLERVVLPELFIGSHIDRLGLPAEGNAPGVNAVLYDYYKAVIARDWDDERRMAAFALMERLNWGPLIRRVIHISFAPNDSSWEKVSEWLKDVKVPWTVELTVPWQTLTAAIRDLYERGGSLRASELDTLGAIVGTVVKLKPTADKA